MIITTIDELKNALKNGYVFFSYIKSDGSLRFAIGTTNNELIGHFIPQSDNKSSARRVLANNFVHYFDLCRMGFRQFSINRFETCFTYNLGEENAIAHAMAIINVSTEFSYEDFKNFAQKYYGEENFDKLLINVYSQQDCLRGKEVSASVRIDSIANAVSLGLDRNAMWCVKHNNSKGLNGVSLAAGGIISSGYDCFGNPIGCKKTSHKEKEEYNNEIPFELTYQDYEKMSNKKHFNELEENVGSENVEDTPKFAEHKVDKEKRFELVKSILAGNVYVDRNNQDQMIKAAFEMADKVLAKLGEY